jgi:hypothetical protein
MRHALFSTTIISFKSPISRKIPIANNPFALLLDALHRSRRLQAEKILGQHRHLIDRYVAKHQPVAPASNAEGDDHVGH